MVLSALSLAGLAAAAALLVYIISAVRTAARLSAFPGPRLASFSYLWMIRNAISGRMGQIYYREATLRYGDVVRVGPHELITSDPDLVRRLSATRSSACQYHRSSWYALNRLDPYEDSMFSLRDDVAHDGLKARTATAYAGRENPALEPEVDTVLREFVAVLRATARRQAPYQKDGPRPKDYVPVGPGFGTPGSPTGPTTVRAPAADLAVLAQYFTLDSITRVAFGSAFGFLSRQEDVHAYLKSIREMAATVIVCAEVPYLARIMSSSLVLRLAGPKLTDKQGVGRLISVAREIVAERFAPDAKDRRDMLGAFVRNGLTQRQCETEALFQIVAGSDTTATAIRMILLYVIVTPRIYYRLQAEIDSIQDQIPPDEHVGNDIVPTITPNAVVEKLPYLQAVIWEGLRIHPPFVGQPFKEVPAQGDTINGHFVPGGTRIAPSLWALARRADIFGDDVDVFRPERWLAPENGEVDKDREARMEMRRTVELLFGYGRWACAGKPLAFLELNKVVAELFRQFDFQLVNVLNPVTSINFNLFMQSDMWVHVTERKSPPTGTR